MSWTVSNLRCLLERTFLSKKAASLQKKNHKYWGVVLSALTSRKSGALFQFLKGRWLQRLKRQAGENLSGLIFYNRRIVHMGTQNTSRQLRYLEEIRISLHRAGFGTLPLEGAQLPVLWNGAPLCRITGKGSVFYRREDADTSQAEDALYRVEDIAAKTLEYMTAMEAAPQLKASGLDGDYRILADFGGTVLAGSPSKYGVQFVTWDWDYDRTGVVHGHYFMENYRRPLRLRQDHSLQSHGAVLGRAGRHRVPWRVGCAGIELRQPHPQFLLRVPADLSVLGHHRQ